MVSFEESVKDIEGLTNYEEGKLPCWLKEQVLYFYAPSIAEPIADAELIEQFVAGSWLEHWGVATIHGDEVAVFEHLEDDPMEVDEAAYVAECINCGFVVVEPSEKYIGGCTTYLTERKYLKRRREVAIALEGNVR